MDLDRARYIIRSGVIPGEIDSVDLWRAEGYIECHNKAEPLMNALIDLIRCIEVKKQSIPDCEIDLKQAKSAVEGYRLST